MNNAKRLYETTCIVNASLEDAQIEAMVAHLSEVITRNGGEITATNRWGRKRLAYPIQKKNNGFYINIEFMAANTTNAQLERTYMLDENILRFLTVHLDKKALMARQQAPASIQGNQPSAATSEAPKEPLFEDDAPSADVPARP